MSMPFTMLQASTAFALWHFLDFFCDIACSVSKVAAGKRKLAAAKKWQQQKRTLDKRAFSDKAKYDRGIFQKKLTRYGYVGCC